MKDQQRVLVQFGTSRVSANPLSPHKYGTGSVATRSSGAITSAFYAKETFNHEYPVATAPGSVFANANLFAFSPQHDAQPN